MSPSHRHRLPGPAAHGRPRVAGSQVAVAAVLVVAALLLVPWAASRLTTWTPAPALAGFAALVPALYLWFRRVQQTGPRPALGMAVAYAAIVAAVLWAWRAA